jgi:hypothetical protein
MLSEDDKNRIRLEEEGKAQARAEALEHAARTRASDEYRKQIRAELISKRRKNVLWWTIPILVLAGIGAGFFTQPSPPEISSTTDGIGGIRDAPLIARCQDQMRVQLNDSQATFPAPEESLQQISASSDGKRWDAWVICPGLPAPNRLEFSCRYTPQTDSLEVEIIK